MLTSLGYTPARCFGQRNRVVHKSNNQRIRTSINPSVSKRLLRLLGLGFGLAVVVGGTTGTGILATPAEVAQAAGTPSRVLLFWLLGGLYTLLGAVQLAELGTMLPYAGGWMAYAERAFGRYVGYVVAWADWVSSCVTGALVALLSADFVTQLLPALAGYSTAVALALVAAFGAVQWRGVRAGSQAQEWTSLLMAAGLAAVVVGCFGWLPAAPAAPAVAPAPAFSLASLMVLLQAVVFAYDGWYAAIYFAEEDHDPAQDLPRSLLLGVGLILLTYLLLNAALLHALPLTELARAPLPLAAAAGRLAGSWGERAVLVVALLALGGVLNSVLLMATRVLFALGRDGLMPGRLAQVSLGGTPRPALAVALLLTAALVLSGTAEGLLAVTTILYVGYYAVGYAAVLVLRHRAPQLPRPFRAWGYPLTTLVVLAGSVAFLLGNVLADPHNSLVAGALLLLSYPAYRWAQHRRQNASMGSDKP